MQAVAHALVSESWTSDEDVFYIMQAIYAEFHPEIMSGDARESQDRVKRLVRFVGVPEEPWQATALSMPITLLCMQDLSAGLQVIDILFATGEVGEYAVYLATMEQFKRVLISMSPGGDMSEFFDFQLIIFRNIVLENVENIFSNAKKYFHLYYSDLVVLSAPSITLPEAIDWVFSLITGGSMERRRYITSVHWASHVAAAPPSHAPLSAESGLIRDTVLANPYAAKDSLLVASIVAQIHAIPELVASACDLPIWDILSQHEELVDRTVSAALLLGAPGLWAIQTAATRSCVEGKKSDANEVLDTAKRIFVTHQFVFAEAACPDCLETFSGRDLEIHRVASSHVSISRGSCTASFALTDPRLRTIPLHSLEAALVSLGFSPCGMHTASVLSSLEALTVDTSESFFDCREARPLLRCLVSFGPLSVESVRQFDSPEQLRCRMPQEVSQPALKAECQKLAMTYALLSAALLPQPTNHASCTVSVGDKAAVCATTSPVMNMIIRNAERNVRWRLLTTDTTSQLVCRVASAAEIVKAAAVGLKGEEAEDQCIAAAAQSALLTPPPTRIWSSVDRDFRNQFSGKSIETATGLQRFGDSCWMALESDTPLPGNVRQGFMATSFSSFCADEPTSIFSRRGKVPETLAALPRISCASPNAEITCAFKIGQQVIEVKRFALLEQVNAFSKRFRRRDGTCNADVDTVDICAGLERTLFALV